MKIDRAYEQDLQLAIQDEEASRLYPTQPVVSGGRAAADESLKILDPSLENASDTELSDVRFSMSRFDVETETQQQLETGSMTPESLEMLRTQYVTQDPDPDRIVVGALKALTPYEKGIPTAESLKADRQRIIEAAKEFAGGVVFDNSVLGVAKDAVDAGVRMFLPTQDSTSEAFILGAAFPELRAEALVNLGSALAKARVKLQDMDYDKAYPLMQAMDAAIDERIQFGWTSDLQEWEFRTTLFGGLAEGGTATDLITTGVQWIENLAAVPIIKTWGKTLGNVGKGITAASAAGGTGLVKGTKNWAISQSTEGVKALAANLRNRAIGGDLPAGWAGSSPEDILDTIALPKLDGNDLTAGPYVPSAMVPKATRDRLLADPSYVHGTVPTNRINQAKTVSGLRDGGVFMDITVGNGQGVGYKTAKSATRAMKQQGWKGEVVQEGSGFFIRLKGQRQFGLEEAGESAGELTQGGYAFWKNIGKHVGATPHAIQSSNIAARQTEKTVSSLAKLIDPYTSMPAGSQQRVAKLLDKGDEKEKLFSVTYLQGKGLNPAEIKAYYSIRKLANIQADMTDVRLWHKYTAAGYKSLDQGGHLVGLKVLDDAGVLPSSTTVQYLDGTSGALGVLPKGQRLARLMVPDAKTGARFLVMPEDTVKKLGDLPRKMTNRKDGYLPRPYRHPYYVKLFEPGQARPATIEAARSKLEAEEQVALLREQFPGKDYQAVQAVELRQVDDLDELEAMDEAGLLWTNQRGPSRLRDPSGNVRLPTVEDRILQMVDDTAMSAGLGRWADANKRAWQQRYGDLFSDKWGVGKAPGSLNPKAVANADLVAQAKHDAEFINNVSGVGHLQQKQMFGSASNWLADRVYNAAARVDRAAKATRGGKADSQLGNDLRNLADNINGQSGRVLANAKTLPYLVYLAANPLRQLPLQMTLIPSYFGVQGGGKYLLGGFQKDFASLFAAGVVEGGAKLNPELVAQFRRSGLVDSLDHHTLLAGIGGQGSTTVSSQASQLGRAVQSGTNALTRVGIGAGIKMEKVSAWLIARNRWMVQNPSKKIDEVAEQEIASFAEELSLNPNRSDRLAMQDGLLGVFTQFLSMQVKQMGRTLQALGAPTGSLSRGEAARMAAVNFGMWGVAGYGVTSAVSEVMEHSVLAELPDVVREQAESLLNEGLINYTVDAVMGLSTGDRVDTAFTESFSPNAQIGGTARLVDNLVSAVAFGEWAGLGESRWQAPALGLTGQLVDFFKFASAINGAPPLPGPNSDQVKRTAVAKRALQLVPATNNYMKMRAAMEMRASFNRRGDPVAEASFGEALVMLSGAKTREEQATWEMSKYLSNGFGSREKEILSIRDHAYQASQWMLPLLDEYVEGKITLLEAQDYIDQVTQFAMDTLGEVDYNEFAYALKQQVDKRWRTRYNVLVDRILHDAETGKLPITKDALPEVLALIPDPQKRDELEAALRWKLFGERN